MAGDLLLPLHSSHFGLAGTSTAILTAYAITVSMYVSWLEFVDIPYLASATLAQDMQKSLC